jgi:two-component system, cell cycle response regulator CtrA
LRARIAAVCRRHRGYAQSPIQVGALSLSLDSHAVSFRDIPVRLTITEYAMLELLVLRKGQVVSKETFLNHLYGGVNEPENKTIDVFICKIRSKLVSVGGAGDRVAWIRSWLRADGWLHTLGSPLTSLKPFCRAVQIPC